MADQSNSNGYSPTHRYLPTEGPRQVVEESNIHPTKFAGELGFDPVTTVKVADKNVYVKPVKNTSNRALSPNVVNSAGQISVRGERVIGLGEQLHNQIRAKINNAVSTLNYQPEENLVSKYITPADTNLEPIQKPITKVAPNSTDQTAEMFQSQKFNTESKGQLEQINKVLFEQIKGRVASELAKQQLTPNPTPKLPTNPLSAVRTLTTQKEAVNESAILKNSFPRTAPTLTKPVAPNKSIPRSWTQLKPAAGPKIQVKPRPELQLNPDQLKLHIGNLENEIKILVKEVENLDKSIKSRNSEKTNQELTNLERQIEVDQKMLAAVAEWRLALNNLINSHSIAIKYLKEKTDWLEQNLSHGQKHNKFHRAAGNFTLDQKPLTNTVLPTVNKNPQPPYIKAVRDLVELALKMEGEFKETNLKANKELVKDIVKETLQQERLVKNDQPEPKTPVEIMVKPKESSSTSQPEIRQPSPTTQVEKQETDRAEKESLAEPEAVAVKVDTQDIEKQILAQAEKESEVKEAISRAKEEAAKAVAQEKIKKEAANKQTADKKPAEASISPEILKSEFDKLKASLTRFDTNHLTNLPKQQRTEMIQKLENLEKASVISKQFDEIKAVAERRRINQELSGMLHLMGEKPAEPTATTQDTQQKMETLKTEEKKKTSPAEKARLIAEIKELERQAQAKKTQQLSRPAVKAQPAFGKMLPNTPTSPNVINGIVKDTKGLLLSTVVIIVTDDKGTPVRAFKTNKIGQFALSTPVPNGVYRLELEKAGYDFDIIEVDVNGAILPPIEIKAK